MTASEGVRRPAGIRRAVPVRLDEHSIAALDDCARRVDSTRSDVIREAIRTHLGRPTHGELALTLSQLDRLRQICERYGIHRLEVFGSFARGEGGPDSDIDLLYSLVPGVRLGWEIEDLSEELSVALGRPVDLVAREAVHHRLRDDVLSEARCLYAA